MLSDWIMQAQPGRYSDFSGSATSTKTRPWAFLDNVDIITTPGKTDPISMLRRWLYDEVGVNAAFFYTVSIDAGAAAALASREGSSDRLEAKSTAERAVLED